MKLFLEHGYDETTAAQIAAGIGVTERTFFRYFPDKREILFGGEEEMRDVLINGIHVAPEGLSPLDMLFSAYEIFRPAVEHRRGYVKPRQQIIAGTPALRERELTKIASIADAVSGALKSRGVPPLWADLTAQIGMASISHATLEWLDDDNLSLAERLRIVREALRHLL